MNLKPSIDMAEATRLTREGRLHEAMALLQGRGASVPTEAGAASPDDTIDMQPPAAGSGGAWTPLSAPVAAQAGPHARAANPSLPASLLGKLRSMPLAGASKGGRATDAPALPEGARFETRRHQGRGDGRAYRLYVPGSYSGEPLPLVVMLHGCTQSPEDFAAGTGMNALAEEQSFLVAWPEQSAAANGNRCWNWFNPQDQQRDLGEPALIAGIAREVMGEFAVDPARVYIAGLSAGGAAAVIVARAYPELFSAAGVHSGLASGAASDMASAFAAMRQGGSADPSHSAAPLPTIVFHGDQDRTVSPVNAQQVLAQARGGAQLESTSRQGSASGGRDYTITAEADASGKPILEHWLLHGVGHAWSGGSDAGSYTDPHGPDASREMMRFFSHHTGSAHSR
jgi:poly(hydroxyalkanoate) depolymerase family esterase